MNDIEFDKIYFSDTLFIDDKLANFIKPSIGKSIDESFLIGFLKLAIPMLIPVCRFTNKRFYCKFYFLDDNSLTFPIYDSKNIGIALPIGSAFQPNIFIKKISLLHKFCNIMTLQNTNSNKIYLNATSYNSSQIDKLKKLCSLDNPIERCIEEIKYYMSESFKLGAIYDNEGIKLVNSDDELI